MAHASRTSKAEGHILIGGTGRAGTTLLVQYFTAMGFDTGFTLEKAMAKVDPISKAGLEHPVARTLRKGSSLAYVAKSPLYGDNLRDFLESGGLKVKHCIIPVRELTAAAESRRHVTRQAIAAGKPEDEKHRGGITTRPKGSANQEAKLAVQFHQLVFTMLHFDVPIHFLKFPEFAQGQQDVYTALRPLLEEHGVTPEESAEAMQKVLRPEYINDFTQAPPPG